MQQRNGGNAAHAEENYDYTFKVKLGNKIKVLRVLFFCLFNDLYFCVDNAYRGLWCRQNMFTSPV